MKDRKIGSYVPLFFFEAVALAKAAKRNTVMKVDMAAAIEKYLKKTDLTWEVMSIFWV